MSGLRFAVPIVFVLSLAILPGCGRSDAALVAQAPEKPGVEVRTVSRGDLIRVLSGSANLSANRAASVVAESAGEVEQMFVEEGDHVSAGQVLARLDSQRLRLALAQQRSIEQRLAHEAERSHNLARRQLISAEAEDRARFDHAAQRAALDLAALDLAHAEIRAPFSGVITRRHIKPGQTLARHEVAFDLADFASLEARLSVPEAALADIKVGQSAEFSADAFPGQRFHSQVQRVPAVVDATTGTAAVTLAVDAAQTTLRPGQMVRVRITLDRQEDAVLVPRSALLDTIDGEPTVFVIDQGLAHRRAVQLGSSQDDLVQILSGLEPGEQVAVLGHSQLSDQQAVLVIREQDSPASAVPLAAL